MALVLTEIYDQNHARLTGLKDKGQGPKDALLPPHPALVLTEIYDQNHARLTGLKDKGRGPRANAQVII